MAPQPDSAEQRGAKCRRALGGDSPAAPIRDERQRSDNGPDGRAPVGRAAIFGIEDATDRPACDGNIYFLTASFMVAAMRLIEPACRLSFVVISRIGAPPRTSRI